MLTKEEKTYICGEAAAFGLEGASQELTTRLTLTYRWDGIPREVMAAFCRNRQADSNMYTNGSRPRIAKTILRRKQSWQDAATGFKTCY